MSFFPSSEWYLEVAKGNVPGHSIVNKFGTNAGVPNGSFEMLTSLSVATYAGFLQAATTVRVKAGGDAADDIAGAGARTVFIEGVDSTLARVSEEVDLAGASASAATAASFWRVDRAYIGGSGAYGANNTGAVVIETSGGTEDLIQILAGIGQSQHCCTAIPDATTAYLIGYEITVDASKAANVRMFAREGFNVVAAPFKPPRLKHYWDGVLGNIPHDIILPERLAAGPADIWMEAEGGGAGTEASAIMSLLLVAD